MSSLPTSSDQSEHARAEGKTATAPLANTTTPTPAFMLAEPLVFLEEDNAASRMAAATPRRFLYWGLFAKPEGMVLFCIAMMALCIAFVSLREMVVGLSPEDVEEGDTPGFVLIIFVVSSLLVVILFFVRVWRKHARQQRILLQEQQMNNNSNSQTRDEESPSSLNTTSSTTWIYSWGYLCKHTAIEFTLASSWALAIIVYSTVRRATIQEHLPVWVDLGLAYALLFIMFSACVRWYNPVQRYSEQLANLKIPTGQGIALMMFHLICASLAFHCSTVIIDDMHDDFWWALLQFFAMVIGLAFLSNLIPRVGAVR